MSKNLSEGIRGHHITPPEIEAAKLATPQSDKIVKKQRDSNIELIRVVAMSLILVHHFEAHAICDGEAYRNIYRFIYPFLFCGVNLFFMISGWCQIKSPIRGIIKLGVTLFIFYLINQLLLLAVGCDVSWIGSLKAFFFPFTKTQYWFIQVYLLLLVVSPFLNVGINSLDIKKLRVVMALFTFITVYSCGIGHNLSNPNGYSFCQGMYMYCLAAYLRRDEQLRSRLKKSWMLIGYFVILIISGLFNMSWDYALQDLQYNSLPMILAAAFLFLILIKYKFQSKFVNRLGAASLGCYLLQDGIFGNTYFYNLMHGWFTSYPALEWMAMHAGVFIAFWLVALLIMPVVSRFAQLVLKSASRVKVLR
jgi:hypothetical protein